MALEITPKEPEHFADEDLENDRDGTQTELTVLCPEEHAEALRFPLTMAPYPQEDDYDETGCYDHMAVEYVYYGNVRRRNKRNSPRQRAILRQFYYKLGELSQLQFLNMTYCKFRVRVKDGLEFVLPGLQQNLIQWKLDLEGGNSMGKSELGFFCKHFGYGHDITIAKDQDQLEGKTRRAQLQELILNEIGLRDVSFEELDWATRQGFRVSLT
ncbi:hypothetical protein EC968_007206 [Mortierella alpina]|nr:hypothetical protein EC968_007206 [Mortierella alpina]